MAAKPQLPDGFSPPPEVNDWVHDPESNKNGHAYYSPDRTQSVAVYSHLGSVYAKVADERADGFERGQSIVERDLADEHTHTSVEYRMVLRVLDAMLDWMQSHPPGEWSHSRVNEAVFDPPPGYSLARYYVENRDTTVYYHRDGRPEGVRMHGDDAPDAADPTPETHPYLVVHCWNGSGNATVSVAPWLRAHDHEMHEVVETPEECGLDVALMKAREYAREHVDADEQGPTVGQTNLDAWGETA